MNKTRMMILLIILPLLFGTSYSQTNYAAKIQQYLYLKAEFEQTEIQNVADINSLMIRTKIIIDSVDNYKFGSFKFYFNKQGINFYEFTEHGRDMDVSYSSIAGVDYGNNVIIVKNPIDAINRILAKTNKCDSASFSDYVEIYNKLEFCDRDIQFLEKYDPKIFGSSFNYENYNQLTTEMYGDFQLLKLFREEVLDVIEYSMIRYSYSRGKFSTEIILKYRFPK